MVYVSVDSNGNVALNPSTVTLGNNQSAQIVVVMDPYQNGGGTLGAVTVTQPAGQNFTLAQFPAYVITTQPETTAGSASISVTVNGITVGNNPTGTGTGTLSFSGTVGATTTPVAIPGSNQDYPQTGTADVYINFQYNNGSPTWSYRPTMLQVGPGCQEKVYFRMDPASTPGWSLAAVSMAQGVFSSGPPSSGSGGTVAWSGDQPEMAAIAVDVNNTPNLNVPAGQQLYFPFTVTVTNLTASSMTGSNYFTSPDPEIENNPPG